METVQKCTNKNKILLKIFNNNIKTTVNGYDQDCTSPYVQKAHNNKNGKTGKMEWREMHLRMNDVSDSCLATGGETIEKVS